MVKIESCLAQHRNSIKINSYSRTVDTTSNAAYIHSIGKTRTIVGHYKIRNIAGKFTQIARTQSLHLIRTKGSAAERLLTKTEILLRLRNNHDFINVKNSAAISQRAISSRKLFTRTQRQVRASYPFVIRCTSLQRYRCQTNAYALFTIKYYSFHNGCKGTYFFPHPLSLFMRKQISPYGKPYIGYEQ